MCLQLRGNSSVVEHNLAKVGVASSNLVSRSKQLEGWVAEWLCSGLQIRGRRFDSDPSLHFSLQKNAPSVSSSPDGEIGRHKGFKIPRPYGCAGSSPAPGTNKIKHL